MHLTVPVCDRFGNPVDGQSNFVHLHHVVNERVTALIHPHASINRPTVAKLAPLGTSSARYERSSTKMTSTQRQLSATIAKSIESMSAADASKTLRVGVVNLLDEYLRVTPANHAVLITSTADTGTGTADMSLLLNNAIPQHIAGSVAEHAHQIKALLAQAATESVPPTVEEVRSLSLLNNFVHTHTHTSILDPRGPT